MRHHHRKRKSFFSIQRYLERLFFFCSEQPISTTVNNLLLDSCFKSSPTESGAAVELYTPFAASPPNQMTIPLSPQTSHPTSSALNSPPATTTSSSRTTTSSPPQPTPIAFFSVNRSDRVIIYFDQTYQHYMIYTSLPTLHFIHSDCYEMFHIQQKQNSSLQQQNNTSINESSSADLANLLTNNNNPTPALINTSMISSTVFGTNGLNPSSTPLLGQVTDKEYCQAKKPNNRFNVPLGTKFYRVRVKPWKPSISSSPSN